MTDLVSWLSALPNVLDAAPVAATIQGEHYEGASYRDRETGDLRYYLLGDLPRAYRRSSKTAFVLDDEDWYIACYMKAPIPEQFAEFHPFGPHFMLCRWSVPSGEAIDAHYWWRGEKRSYRRVPVNRTDSSDASPAIA